MKVGMKLRDLLTKCFRKPVEIDARLLVPQAGMTLIEIIIVVALLGTLMAYLVSNLTDRAESAKQDQSKIAMGQLAQSLEMYKIHTGKYPDSLQELLSNTTNNPKWRGPYTEENKTKDPWDQEFQYSKDGRKYKIITPSTDGELGTADDVVYPEGAAPSEAATN